MLVPFHKMHGAGNDFIVVDERQAPVDLSEPAIAALADRHFGIGCDQFITVGTQPGADARLRFFNPDGGEAGACGNGTRCVADLLMREDGRADLRLRTVAGELHARRMPNGQVSVDMGPPALGWAEIPLTRAVDTLHLPLDGDPAAVSMGNPHATFFGTDLDRAGEHGAIVERDGLFAERANIGFVHVLAPDRLRLRVWERGAGLTLACGSGACAAVVNASRRGLTGRSATVEVDGGVLDVAWREDGHVTLAGPAVTVFQGAFDPAAFPN